MVAVGLWNAENDGEHAPEPKQETGNMLQTHQQHMVSESGYVSLAC